MSSSRPTALESVRDDSLFELEQALRSIRTSSPRESTGEAWCVAALCHRRLALCALLSEADTQGFFVHLCHSAHARLHLLRRQGEGLALEPLYRCASKAFSFVDALAAGQLPLAADIARLEARSHEPSVEYEEDFLFHHFLHQLTLALHTGATPDLPALLDRWQSVIQEDRSAWLDVCRALLERRADAFNEALAEVVSERSLFFQRLTRDDGPNDELRRTEGAIFMNGLALLRLAELSDMETWREYPTLPRLARFPPGRPSPPPSDWMSLEGLLHD